MINALRISISMLEGILFPGIGIRGMSSTMVGTFIC